jgi:uncharacterized protein
MEVLLHHAEKVRKMYEAFNRGDIPFILSHLHHDCIWEVMGLPDISYAGIYHGPGDCRNFFQKLNQAVEFKEMVPEQIFENGHQVIVTGHMTGVSRVTGKLFSSIFLMLYEFNEEGQMLHFRDCVDTLAISRALTN